MAGSFVSFVVPTRNSARTLEACLTSAREQEGQAVEVIVVDNSSTDGSLQIAQRLADVALTAGPERSAQRNRGLEAARGEYVMFVDSDMVLTPDVAADIVATFGSDPGLGALVIPELAIGSGFLVRCRALEKKLYLGDASVEAARAFPREVLRAVGGYDESLTGGEDWELPNRMRERGLGIGRTTAPVLHDEGEIKLAQQFTKKRYYGRGVGEYMARDASARAHLVRRRSLLGLPLFQDGIAVAAGLVALKAVEFAGLSVGMLDARAERARSRRG